jgi:hypothetical protein
MPSEPPIRAPATVALRASIEKRAQNDTQESYAKSDTNKKNEKGRSAKERKEQPDKVRKLI